MVQAESTFNLNQPMYYGHRHPTLSASSRLERFPQHLFGAAGLLAEDKSKSKTTLFSTSPAAATQGIVLAKNVPSERAVDDSSRASRLVKIFASDQSGFELEDLKGCYIEFSKDQHGSRFLQKELEVVDSDMIQLVFDEVSSVARSLMVDVYGNYVIQKFFDFGTDEQRFVLAGKLCGSVVGLSLHLYGCRVVQKALETLPDYLQAHILTELQEHTLECIKDQHGNHVIQKCFTATPTSLMQLLIGPILCNGFEIATHPFGCRVVQRMLENCSEVQVDQVLTELLQFTELLIQASPMHFKMKFLSSSLSSQSRMWLLGNML